MRRCLLNLLTAVLLLLAVLLYVLLFTTVRNSDDVSFRLPGRTVHVLKVLVPLPLLCASLALYVAHSRRQWLTRRRRAGGLCVACGYDLRGSPTGACPECGADSFP